MKKSVTRKEKKMRDSDRPKRTPRDSSKRPFSSSKREPSSSSPTGGKRPSSRGSKPELRSKSAPRKSGAPVRKLLRRDIEKRLAKFPEPQIPEGITGEELDKKARFQLQSLALENAAKVSQHLVALNTLIDSEPEEAFLHGQAATFRAGRIAYVRERAGIAALRAGRFEIAQKDLRAAGRISVTKEVLPYIAQCEVALGDPRKALEIAGSVDQKELSEEGRVEMRIAASQARGALGQFDAAVVTLTSSELNKSDAPWSARLHRRYLEALLAAGREDEAVTFKARFPHSFDS